MLLRKTCLPSANPLRRSVCIKHASLALGYVAMTLCATTGPFSAGGARSMVVLPLFPFSLAISVSGAAISIALLFLLLACVTRCMSAVCWAAHTCYIWLATPSGVWNRYLLFRCLYRVRKLYGNRCQLRSLAARLSLVLYLSSSATLAVGGRCRLLLGVHCALCSELSFPGPK